MRVILIVLFLHVALFGVSYEFDEYKFVSAAGTEFKKSGTISFDGNKTIITYEKPKYKQIVTDGKNVSMKGKSGKVFNLKGKAQLYTNMFIMIMTKIDDFDELKTSRDFDVEVKKELYILTFKDEIADQILSAKVVTKDSKVLSYKLFMKNDDTLEIVKK